MYYNYRIENRASRNQPPYCLLQLQEKRGHSASSGRVVLGLPSPSPRVCTDVRWRQNQNFSAQRVYTKFAYPWCSPSSVIKVQVWFGLLRRSCNIELRSWPQIKLEKRSERTAVVRSHWSNRVPLKESFHKLVAEPGSSRGQLLTGADDSNFEVVHDCVWDCHPSTYIQGIVDSKYLERPVFQVYTRSQNV